MREIPEAATILWHETELPSSRMHQLAILPGTICPREVSPGPLPASVLVTATELSPLEGDLSYRNLTSALPHREVGQWGIYCGKILGQKKGEKVGSLWLINIVDMIRHNGGSRSWLVTLQPH